MMEPLRGARPARPALARMDRAYDTFPHADQCMKHEHHPEPCEEVVLGDENFVRPPNALVHLQRSE